jgi:hypothetical protein|tara:strand:+ start:2979 stop:3257 length:279 start_codon:yes stop_codon:yes gene_type:complete
MRYDSISIKKDKDGTRYYSPSLIPNIPLKDSDKFVFPIIGDRLDTVAQRYYGDSNLWWIIAKANEISRGQIGLDPEKMIRIPGDIDSILKII